MDKSIISAIFIAISSSSFATFYSAANDFSIASNPNGNWSYGSSTTLNGPVTLFNQGSTLQTDWDSWQTTGVYALGIYKNTGASTLNFSTVNAPAGGLFMHGGPNNEFAVLRFTASFTGTYNMYLGFNGVDFVYPTTTDVHLALNGSNLWSNTVNSYSLVPTVAYSASIPMTAGDTLDAIVGVGSNNNFYGDTTQVEFRLDAVPEPVTFTLIPFAALAALRKKKK